MLVRPRPLVAAHRGFSWVAPENTLAAYARAIEAGADLGECDVHLTRDGVPVLLHDDDLRRTTGSAGKVADRTLEEVRRLDAGSWKAPAFAGERVPTLVEALRLVAGRLRLVIEVKPPGIERAVLAAIREAGTAPEDVFLFSFDLDTLRVLQALEPLLPTAWLLERKDARLKDVLRDALRARVSGLGLPAGHAAAPLLRAAHEHGLLVFVWDVNDEASAARAVEAGADVLISDRPDLVLGLLSRGA